MDSGDLPKDPPDSYAWNNLIQDITEAITETDVLKIKRRFEDIIPMGLRTAEQIMDSLKQNGYISECNIVYLQQIVRVLEKQHLVEKTIYYANESSQKVLHFCEKITVPRSGNELLQIHVKDHKHATQDYLQTLQNRVSKIIQVPCEDISFSGVEETNSLIITLMLPKMYIEVLQDLLGNIKKHYLFAPLLEIKVDEIIISQKSFKIKAATGGENCHTLEKSGKEENVPGLNGNLKMEYEVHSVKKSDDMYLKNKTANQTRGQKRKSVSVAPSDQGETRKKRKPEESWHLKDIYLRPEMKEYIIMNEELNSINQKVMQLASMSTTVRKMIAKIPKHPKKGKGECIDPTPEEINNQSLYAKLRRIYPTVYIPKKETNTQNNPQNTSSNPTSLPPNTPKGKVY